MYPKYLFVGTIELEDRLVVCGDDAAETDEEMAGDLKTMPWPAVPEKRVAS